MTVPANKTTLTQLIHQEAHTLGFQHVGIAPAEAVQEEYAQSFRKWIASGLHGEMQYLANNLEKRLDPRLLMPEAQSIICLAINYYPVERIQDEEYHLSYYAYGQDYHEVVKKKLRTLVERITPNCSSPVEVKICVDTVPILERYWAQQAGIGFIGKNGQLIIPDAGSYFFLAEIVINQELEYNTPMTSQCGDCNLCIKHCPTGALLGDSTMDSRKCFSYLTIEYRGEHLPEKLRKAQGSRIYGCDTCAIVCPFNKQASSTQESAFSPHPDLLKMHKSDWEALDVPTYQRLFKGSAVKRAKFSGLTRNIQHISDKKKEK